MTIRSLPYTTLLLLSAVSLGGCGAETTDAEPEAEGLTDTTEQAATGRHNCGAIGPGNIDAFRGYGQCCKSIYKVRGEAGGYCARNIGNINNLTCRYEVYYAGGWGATSGRRYYTGYCQAY